MTHRINEGDLAELLKKALAMADELGLWGVGARLDQALIDLTGVGVDPADEPPELLDLLD